MVFVKAKDISMKYRSGYEDKVAAYLDSLGIEYKYEDYSFQYYSKVNKSVCGECGSHNIFKERWYTPDFFLANGNIIEAKGYFKGVHRKTILDFLDGSDEVTRDNYYILFQRDNKYANAGNKYSDWCEKNNIKYAISLNGEVPEEWLIG